MRTFVQKPKQAHQSKSTKLGRGFPRQNHDIHSFLNLQRTLGNQAARRLQQSYAEERNTKSSGTEPAHFGHDFSRIPVTHPKAGTIQMPARERCVVHRKSTTCKDDKRVQPKLEVGAIDDPLEAEAVREAARVLASPDVPIEPGHARAHLQPQRFDTASGVAISAPVAVRIEAARAGGEPLLTATRSFFEPRFQYDFSSVRVHHDAAATRSLGARAFTSGRDVFFAPGEYDPASTKGRTLIAHELAHVVQQGGASALIQRTPNPQASEVERAVNEMWGAVNSIDEVGAEIEFLYYTSNGAMTLVEIKRTAPGGKPAPSADRTAFEQTTFGFKGGSAVGSSLVTFVGNATRYLQIKLKRTQGGWNLQGISVVASGQPKQPPEGRTQASGTSAGWPVNTYVRVQNEVNNWMPLLNAYPGGSPTMKFEAEFEDDRLVSLKNTKKVLGGGKGPSFVPAASGTKLMFIQSLLAFSQGLGKRKLQIALAGTASSSKVTWKVSQIATDRGPAPKLPDEAEAIVAEYRHMHEEIIRKWREGVKEAAVYAGMLGVEQLAWWLIGGVVAKGLGLVFKTAAPRLIGFIRAGSKGGSKLGVEYLETMIARLGTADRAEMQALARKAETEGVEALTKAERSRLGNLLKKIEGLIDKPLTNAEKGALRGRMATRFKAGKVGVDAAFQAAGRTYQIHHRIPLEYAQHFPGFDVNTAKNLIGLETEVHRGVNAMWTRLRTSAPAGKLNGNVVNRVAALVDKHFGKWYDKVPRTSGTALATEIDAAKSACVSEIDKLVRAL